MTYQQALKFLDMNELLRQEQLHNRWLFVDRVHCTDEGYQLVTNVIEQEVLN